MSFVRNQDVLYVPPVPACTPLPMLPDMVPVEGVPGSPPHPRATRRRQRASPPPSTRSGGFWEFFTAHIRNRNNPPRVPRGRAPLRRVVRTPRTLLGARSGPWWLRPTSRSSPGRSRPRASSSTSLRSGCSSTGSSSARSCPFTPGARSGTPSHDVQTGKTPGPSAKETRAGPLTASTSRRSSVYATALSLGVLVYSFARVSAGGLASRCGLLHPGTALVLPAPREGRPVQRGPGPPTPPRNTSIPTLRPPGSARTAAGPSSGAANPDTAMCSKRGDVAGGGVKDDQAPRPQGRATGRDLRPQLSAGPGSPSICGTAATSEVAARITGHEFTHTTQLYNRLQEEISLDEIERIHIQAERGP